MGGSGGGGSDGVVGLNLSVMMWEKRFERHVYEICY